MKRLHDHLGINILLAAGMVAYGLVGVAAASPRYGGECGYCHTNEKPDALQIEGFKTTQEEMKVFEVTPGGSVDFVFNVDKPDRPEYYRLVVRGLDYLNGEDERGLVINSPRMYTPDEDWKTKGGTTQSQYIFHEGQFYEMGPSDVPEEFVFSLTVAPDAELGLYPLNVNVGGGTPENEQIGQRPMGGWYFEEDFLLNVVPEPGSAFLMLMGVVMLGSIRRWGRKSAALALVLTAGLVTTNVAQAYPSRSGNCAVCHSIQGPTEQTGDFEILNTDGVATSSFTAAPGDSVEFRFDFTQLVENSETPGTFNRGYLILDRLDLLSIDAGPPPATDDIMYTTPKYTPLNLGEEAGQWHDHRNEERYMGAFGQYYAQSSSELNASMLFPLTLGTDVAPGTYHLTATLAGGAVTDVPEGWYVTKNFTLNVSAPGLDETVTIPEPSSLVLLGLAVPMLLRRTRRRR